MRRRERRVPDTAQRSLGWGGEPDAACEAVQTKKARSGGTAFREATPWHLYVGNGRLDRYLTTRAPGLGGAPA
ncbi:MAG: hypothetical protein ABSA52_18560 [Candidatus Binatia bacterium]|jgi:hypothetical protein